MTGIVEGFGNVEAGRGDEACHDQMWYQIRDTALGDPEITPDMFEELPFAPPPGYQSPAKASAEALGGIRSGTFQRLFPTLSGGFEALLSGFAQLLLIEHGAYAGFAWAREVLSDPTCSASPEWAPGIIGYI